MTDQDTPQIPVLQDLNAEMRCGMFTNAKGEIMIVHDQGLASSVQWVEYDEGENTFSIIHEDGHIQPLGLQLDKKMKANLKNAKEITLAHLINKKIQSFQTVTFIIKNT